MAGRSGGSPMPPAMTTTSLPSARSTGQLVPYGPRTPIWSPGRAAHSAWLTAPTSRIVCSTGPGDDGSPLIEIGTSPTPGARSMLNWPGRKPNGPGGCSASVTTSCDSRLAAVPRHGGDSVHGRCAAASAGGRMTVDVRDLQPGGLQPPRRQQREPLHEVEAEPRVGVAPGPQARAVHLQGPHPPDGPPVEVPAVRAHQPGEADHLPGAEGLYRGDPARRGDLQRDRPLAHQVERLRRVALAEQERAVAEHHVPGAAGDQLQVRRVHPGEELVAAQHRLKCLRQWRPPPR